jgi:hypothetical protein
MWQEEVDNVELIIINLPIIIIFCLLQTSNFLFSFHNYVLWGS